MERTGPVPGLTYADYLRLPDDNLRHEIINGVHYVTPSPVTRHQRISGRLWYLLQGYLERHPIGEVFAAPFDVLLSDFDIVVPDLVYLSNERRQFLTEKNLQGPPDLVIEILSPGTRKRDQRLKRDLYERAGVREYWLVNPDENVVTVYRRNADWFEAPVAYARDQSETVATKLLPGLEITLESLLA